MANASLRVVLAASIALFAIGGFAQGTGAVPAAAAAPSAPEAVGPGQPRVVVPATSSRVTVSVTIREKPPLLASDFSLGEVTNSEYPALVSRPTIESFAATASPDGASQTVRLGIGGLFAFGESSVALLHRGTPVETLRFARPGLAVRPAAEEGFVAREDSAAGLVLVLDNPAGFGYDDVRARLRFADFDVCAFGGAAAQPRSCADSAQWSAFKVQQYARVSLRAVPAAEWFRDPATGRARVDSRKGLLTLHFRDPASGAVFEQNLPLEVRFVPDAWSQAGSLGWVALWLLVGAIGSLLLRVSIPNMKRKRQLKDQLGEAAKLISAISTEVDSNLRVLLRVERLALDEIRQAGWQIGPGYADYAQRVEQGLPALKRRIDAVRRLDATLIRRRMMMEQGPAPTRLEQVEEWLAIVSEALKQDSLSDEEWVLVNQRLEAAQKIMREPTPTEKEAFEAMLSGRWKAIRKHFGDVVPLILPPALVGMEPCLPIPSLLPRNDDPDASQWIKEVGPVRADLQLSALALVWEFEFLAPVQQMNDHWARARDQLTRLLATPAVNNLREARSVLRQLAEDVAEKHICDALVKGDASIVMDPAVPRPNQKIRFSVRLRPEHLNSAAARGLVTCRWTFADRHTTVASQMSGMWARLRSTQDETPNPAHPQVLSEGGWDVHHYFERDVDWSEVSVSFHDSQGAAIALDATPLPVGGKPWYKVAEPVISSRRPKEKWARAWLETVQVGATLLVPLATLATTTLGGSGGANWWELIAIGFASDTIKNALVGTSAGTPAGAPRQ